MDILAKVTMPTDSGMVKDYVTNSFVFDGIPDMSWITSGGGDSIGSILEDFYTLTPTGGLQALDVMYSTVMSEVVGACTVDLYNITDHLDGSPAGSPIWGSAFTLGSPSAASGQKDLPSEVSFVLQLRAAGRAAAPVEVPDDGDADTVPQRPKQRRTGRLYLGPFNSTVVDSSDFVARPGSNLQTTARLAAKDLQANADLLGINWCVWSRKDGVTIPIDSVATDNAFDTQRRRGESATVVTALSIVP